MIPGGRRTRSPQRRWRRCGADCGTATRQSSVRRPALGDHHPAKDGGACGERADSRCRAPAPARCLDDPSTAGPCQPPTAPAPASDTAAPVVRRVTSSAMVAILMTWYRRLGRLAAGGTARVGGRGRSPRCGRWGQMTLVHKPEFDYGNDLPENDGADLAPYQVA